MVRNSRQSRPLLLLLAYAGFISLGLPDAVSGVAWPSLRDGFGLPQAGLGSLLVASMSGYLASGLLAARVLGVTGVGGLLVGSTALVALGLAGFVVSPAWLPFLACALVWGVGSGAIDTGLNSYAAKHFSLRHMNWLHGCYTVGAAGGPFIMTAVLVRGLSWRIGYAAIATILFVMMLAFAFTRRKWEDGAPASPEPEREPVAPAAEDASILAAIRSPVVVLQAVLFAFATGLEASAGQWCFTFFSEHRGVPVALAGTWTTAYWVTFAAGRFLLGAVAERAGAGRLLRWGGAAAVAGWALFGMAPPWIAAFGLALVGLGLAPVYPTLMSRTPARVERRFVHAAVGIQVCAGTIGAAIFPAVTGMLTGLCGLGAVGMLGFGLAVAFWAAHELLLRTVRRRNPAIA